MPTFTPRSYEESMVSVVRHSGDRLWIRMTVPRSYALLKNDGFYREVINPTAEEVEAADIAYLGGHTYTVSTQEATELAAAGYTTT